MQIILTEEEYKALKDSGNVHKKVAEMVADYQRKFRLKLGERITEGCPRSSYHTISIHTLRLLIDEAEEFAKKIS